MQEASGKIHQIQGIDEIGTEVLYFSSLENGLYGHSERWYGTAPRSIKPEHGQPGFFASLKMTAAGCFES